MLHPDHPSSNAHVLQRQPRLSLLGREQGPSGKDGCSWWAKGRLQERQVQRPTSLKKVIDDRLDPRLYAAVLKETTQMNPRRISRDKNNWDAMAEVLNDVSRPVEPASSDGQAVANHSSAPHALPHHWAYLGQTGSSAARRSAEWETETLLDQRCGSLDLDMYPCPFRKRNPARFNIRDHEACARAPFDSILRLKHHVTTHHGRKPNRHQCRRCKQQFEAESALEAHLLLPRDQMCDVNLTFYNDPEDGITEETVRILAARDAPEEAWTWDGIWRLVFPGDLEVPDPDFQPVAELVEVEQAFDDGQELLKESLREKLKLLVPGAIDDDYLSFLTGQVELVFETHRVNVMKQSLARSCATVSGQLPDTRSVEPSRKPNRRSRRSTLLHTLQRSAPDSTGGLASRRNSRTSGIKQHTANRLSNEPFRLRNMEPSQTTNNFLTQPDRRQPFPEYWIHANPGTTYTTEPLTTPTNTRDSRDSGIGMTCETCGADSCSCSETASSSSCTDDEASDDEFAAHGKQHPEHQQRPQPKYQISERRHPPRQPRLSVDTNVAADMHLLNPRHFSAAERGGRGSQDWEGARSADITGGRFSPASFKQRVLRQQLGPVGV